MLLRETAFVCSRLLALLAGFPLLFCAAEPPGDTAGIDGFVHWLLEDGERLEDLRFAAVVEAVSGCAVLPVDPSDPVDAAMLAHLQATLDAMLESLSAPAHPIHEVGRVNEISRHMEEYLREHLQLEGQYRCEIPPTASGQTQRAGYPDLSWQHIESGRIFYLDPKVYKQGSEDSSFRSFYFEPKQRTNKILADASHLVVGIAHGGKVEGRWQLEAWKIVDLIHFRVRLKAEFQASNRELYQESAVLGESSR